MPTNQNVQNYSQAGYEVNRRHQPNAGSFFAGRWLLLLIYGGSRLMCIAKAKLMSDLKKLWQLFVFTVKSKLGSNKCKTTVWERTLFYSLVLMIECRNVNLQQSNVRKGTPFRWTKLSEDPSCINREKYVFSPEDPVTKKKKMHAWMNGYYNKITTFIQKIHFLFMLILIKGEQKRPEIVFMQKQMLFGST